MKFSALLPSLAFVLPLVSALPLAAADASPATPALPLLAPPFSDHAVLQRDRPVTLWGWSEPGAAVQVTLRGTPAACAVSATADATGRWQAALPATPAGGPYVLEAVSGAHSAKANDVLVGEVWLCSGQSNMEFPVSGAKDSATEKANANFPQIRHLGVARLIAGEPQATAGGTWAVCSPNTVANWTAVGYFFARKLHQDLKVPIGLVNSSYGGTRAECWVTPNALAAIPALAPGATAFADLFKRSQAQRASTGKDYEALVREWYAANDPGSAGAVAGPAWAAAWAQPALPADGWSTVTLPNRLKQAKAVPDVFTGAIWLRREFDLTPEAATKGGMLNLIRVKDINAAWINGTSIGDSESVNWFRKQRIPAGLLKAGKNVVAVRLTCLDGECGLTGNADELSLTPEGQPAVKLAGEWQIRLGAEFAKAPPMPVRFDRVPGPTSLYNGMIAPIQPLTIAGAAWYQGEANTDAAYLYRTLLPGLIADWRRGFAQPDMPFFIVQLPNHMGRSPKPENSAWAEMREAQALTARTVPHAGLTVTIDLGEALNIHPANKQDVGYRLALAVESQLYHLPVAGSGPTYVSQTVSSGKIHLTMQCTGALTTTDGAALTGFTIAGKDRKFVWATATVEGGTLVVSAPEISEPIAVRYAWASNPACNLTDGSKLPAGPFRTDDWPGVTQPK